MSKRTNILFDWEPPRPGKDEGAAVRKVVAEIERNVPGYIAPVPISADDRKDLAESARRREKQRETEHRAALEALEDQEKQLRRQEQRLARLTEKQSEELHRSQQREREQEDRQRERQRRDTSERQRLATLEHEWRSFKARATQAQHEQQREAYFQDLQETVNNLGRMAAPPPAPVEREIVYVEDEEPGGGRLPRLPSWR
jgi:Rad3-related DNA helicase